MPAGGVLVVEFTVRNEGFGELFNPRGMELVLRAAGGQEEIAALESGEPSGPLTATVRREATRRSEAAPRSAVAWNWRCAATPSWRSEVRGCSFQK